MTFLFQTAAMTRSHFGFAFCFARFVFFTRVRSSCAMTFASRAVGNFRANSECLGIPASHGHLDVEDASESVKCLSRHWCNDFDCAFSDLSNNRSCRQDNYAGCVGLTSASACSCRVTIRREETFDCGSGTSTFVVFDDLSELTVSYRLPRRE